MNSASVPGPVWRFARLLRIDSAIDPLCWGCCDSDPKPGHLTQLLQNPSLDIRTVVSLRCPQGGFYVDDGGGEKSSLPFPRSAPSRIRALRP